MPQITHTISNLINGVSQQSPAIRRESQVEEQVNGWSSVIDGNTKRPPTKHVKRLLASAPANNYTHFYSRDGVEQYVLLWDGSTLQAFDGSGAPVHVENPSDPYLPADPSRLKMVTIADTTYAVNLDTTVSMSGVTEALSDPFAIYEIRGAAYEQDYTIDIDDGTYVSTYTTSDGTGSPPQDNRTDYIAQKLNQQLGLTLPGDYTRSRQGSTIRIQNTLGNAFESSVIDGQYGAGLTQAHIEVERFTDLPSLAKDGDRVAVAPDPESDVGRYWVKWDKGDRTKTGLVEGSWVETTAAGLDNTLDSSTMPHTIVRKFDDGAGTITGTPDAPYFEVETFDWADRSVGNAESSPEPSFVGKALKDIFVHAGRLGFITDRTVVLSEAGEFGNFWRSSVSLGLVDSDPIDLVVGDHRVSSVSSAAPLDRNLILFTDQAQFVLDSGDTVLSPRTVEIRATTAFPSAEGVTPLPVGDRVIFPMSRGSHVGLFEYRRDPAVLDTDTANETTAHCQRYVEGPLNFLEASTSENVILAGKKGTATLYVYQWYEQGPQRLQSAWHKWDMGGQIESLRIYATTVYLVVRRGDELHLEHLELDEAQTDDGLPIRVLLDQKHIITGGTYDPVLDETTYDLGFDTSSLVAYRGKDASVPLAEVPVRDATGTTITLAGETDSHDVIFGVPYEYRLTFSPPYLRSRTEEGSVLVNDGRLQILRYIVSYTETGYVRVEVTPRNSAKTYTYKATGRRWGIHGATPSLDEIPSESGDIDVPVRERNDRIFIEAVNDTPFPSNIISASYIADYGPQVRRV